VRRQRLCSAGHLHTVGIDAIILRMKNDLLKQIWRVRDQIGAECGYDLNRLAALVRGEEVKAGKRLVHPPKPAHRKRTATAGLK
jgi:hypothetical protein